MSHETLRDRILDLAYGELDPREAGKVEEHARSCAECGAELARIREARRLVAGLAVEPAPERGERILLAAAREAAERRKARRGLPRWLLGFSVAAASLVAVGAISWRIAGMRPGPGKGDETVLLGRGTPEAPRPKSMAAPPPEERAAPSQEAFASVEAPVAEEGKKAKPAAEARRPQAPSAPREERAAKAADRFARAPEEKARAAPAPGVLGAMPGTGGTEGTPSASERFALAPPAPAARAEAMAEAESTPDEAPSRRSASKAATRERASLAPAGTDAPARLDAAREAGSLRREVRTFPGCPGEARRVVEVDAAGRVVRYVREGTIAGRRLRVEHLFGEDGALAVLEVQDLDRPDARVDGAVLGASIPRRESDAGADAPPRCGE